MALSNSNISRLELVSDEVGGRPGRGKPPPRKKEFRFCESDFELFLKQLGFDNYKVLSCWKRSFKISLFENCENSKEPNFQFSALGRYWWSLQNFRGAKNDSRNPQTTYWNIFFESVEPWLIDENFYTSGSPKAWAELYCSNLYICIKYII